MSAKYGIVNSMMTIDPYDSRMGTKSQIITPELGAEQVRAYGLVDPLCISVGKPYRHFIGSILSDAKYLIDYLDLEGTGIGYQMNFYSTNLGRLPQDLSNYYSAGGNSA